MEIAWQENGALQTITSSNHSSAIAEHVMSTGHNMKWDYFEILARGRSDTLNENVSSEKLYLLLIGMLFQLLYAKFSTICYILFL